MINGITEEYDDDIREEKEDAEKSLYNARSLIRIHEEEIARITRIYEMDKRKSDETNYETEFGELYQEIRTAINVALSAKYNLDIKNHNNIIVGYKQQEQDALLILGTA